MKTDALEVARVRSYINIIKSNQYFLMKHQNDRRVTFLNEILWSDVYLLKQKKKKKQIDNEGPFRSILHTSL